MYHPCPKCAQRCWADVPCDCKEYTVNGSPFWASYPKGAAVAFLRKTCPSVDGPDTKIQVRFENTTWDFGGMAFTGRFYHVYEDDGEE